MIRLTITPLVAAALVCGCASDTVNYPSLARRDVERTPAAPAASPSPSAIASPVVPDAAMTARLDALVDKVSDAHRRFGLARERAQRTVAAGAGSSPGGEAWAVASVALAGLESARSEAMIALADLDALFAEAGINGGPLPAIAAARDKAIAMIAEEDRVLAALRGRLGD